MRTILLVFALVLSSNAAEKAQIRRLSANSQADFEAARNRAIYPSGFEFVIPQLIIGGEWTSTIKLINRGTDPIPLSEVFFFDSTGEFMSATFRTSDGELVTDVGFTFQLEPDAGMLEVTFSGADSETRFGHAQISPDACPLEADCTLYGEVTLKNSNPTRPDFESVFPIEDPSDLQYLLWDHRNGYTSTLYLVNSNLSATDIELEFRDYDDVLIDTVRGQMGGGEAQILVPHALVPATIGRQGTLTIRGTNSEGKFPLVVVTALRINPSNSFTPIRAFTQKF
jgi:hypothetical protein